MKAWTLARRDLRGGWKNFRLALAGLALGVATIAGIGSFGAGMTDGLRENGRAILGGDIALQTAMIAPGDAQRAWLGERGALSLTVDLNAMATAGDKPPLLVGLRAVDALWPLYGEAVLAPPMAVADALATAPDGVAGAVVDAAFLERMGLAPGDGFRLGEGRFRVAARLLDEPDRASAPFQLGPRVIVSQEALRATGLAGPGSLVRHLARLRLPAGVAVETVLDEIAGAWPEAGWRVRSHADANPELRRFLEQLAMFIALVGLAALLVGGIGIAGAVTVWLERKTATIAIMKSLGASAGLIFAVYLLQLAAMAAAGIAAGLAAGALLPLLVAEAARSVLPVAPSAAIHAGPLALAAAFGLAVALMFALLPLARARETPPAALLRRQPRAGRGAPSGWRRFAGGLGPAGGRDLALLALLAAGLAALAVFASADRSLAAWFVGAAAGALLLFRLAGHGVEAAARLAGRLAARGPLALRLALANLHRQRRRHGERHARLRHRAHRAGDGRLRGRQSAPRALRKPAAGRAGGFFRRYPAPPDRALPRHGGSGAGHSGAAIGPQPARAHRRHRRRGGGRSRDRPGGALVGGGRPRRHLCGGAAAGGGAGRRRMVAAGP